MTPTSTRPRFLIVCAASLVLALSALPAAEAHSNNNHGTIKVHDDESVEPPTRNQPHVSCDFWIEGFNMATETGHIEIYVIPPTDPNPPDLVLEESFDGAPEGDRDGFHFNVGPLNLRPGHYKVFAFLDEGHPGNEDHSAKSKVFWVDPCVPECPETINLEATANGDGSVSLDWDDVAGADGYNVYRSSGGGPLVLLDDTTTSDFLDTSSMPGVTYTYAVSILDGGEESEICERVQVTAIPFFPGIVGTALAVLGGVGALFMSRRRS